jgi:hypothetical protein
MKTLDIGGFGFGGTGRRKVHGVPSDPFKNHGPERNNQRTLYQ